VTCRLSDALAQPLAGAAPHRTLDDRLLIADLLGPGAAALVEHIPVGTLLDTDVDQLAEFGLPPPARRRLLAAAELARRFQPAATMPVPLDSPRRLLPHLAELRTKPVEVLGVLQLDARLTVLDAFCPVAGGALMHVNVLPREVFARPIAMRAAAIVLAHNHPSGDPSPSIEDRTFTTTMLQVGRLLSVRVLDHLIVARRGYFSFAEAGILR